MAYIHIEKEYMVLHQSFVIIIVKRRFHHEFLYKLTKKDYALRLSIVSTKDILSKVKNFLCSAKNMTLCIRKPLKDMSISGIVFQTY